MSHQGIADQLEKVELEHALLEDRTGPAVRMPHLLFNFQSLQVILIIFLLFARLVERVLKSALHIPGLLSLEQVMPWRDASPECQSGGAPLPVLAAESNRVIMKRKADAAHASNICSRNCAPLCFASDHALARQKHSVAHMQQHRVVLALQRCRSAAPPPPPAAHAEYQQVKHGPPGCKVQPMS